MKPQGAGGVFLFQIVLRMNGLPWVTLGEKSTKVRSKSPERRSGENLLQKANRLLKLRCFAGNGTGLGPPASVPHAKKYSEIAAARQTKRTGPPGIAHRQGGC